MENQFYPTPFTLAVSAWGKFENNTYSRVLEPSAGDGDLMDPVLKQYQKPKRVDVIEKDIKHHPTLIEKGFKVVDVDFLKFTTEVSYSHIIMNPPFNKGVDHVLHAWEILKHGELVSIVNAETIKNPYSEKRKFLSRLIEDYGSVELIKSAFEDPDTRRKTSVEVALIHLKKESSLLFSVDDFMEKDDREEEVVSHPQELAIPESSIKNTVRAFNAAVAAMKESVKASARASYYNGLIEVGTDKKVSDKAEITFSMVETAINERYDELQEHAWRKVLTATDFTSRFSTKVRENLERQIGTLITMRFTVQNVYSLLEGLLASKTDLDIEMLCEVFDTITKFHTDNRSYYMGWKSNDAHKIGLKIRPKRFILPNMAASYIEKLGWEAEKTVQDIDRAFALLDGKGEPEFSMLEVARNNERDFLSAKRLKSSYFDFRFYKKRGTMHFFPTRPDLVDRLNRIVGKKRQWLPPDSVKVDEAFWIQYSDKVSSTVTKKVEKVNSDLSYYDRHTPWDYVNNPETLAGDYIEACKSLDLPVWNSLECADAPLLEELK